MSFQVTQSQGSIGSRRQHFNRSAQPIKVSQLHCNMEHLNATDQSAAVVESEQFYTFSTVTVMNLLAQLEWKVIGIAFLASALVCS